MSGESEFLVRITGPRPDFRTVISFLWSDFHEVDSDGDSYNPASRTWTDLYLENRENEHETVDVTKEEEEPLVLRVTSPSRSIALGVAYFLVHWASGEILDAESRMPIKEKVVTDELESTFDLLTRVERAEQSIWNHSTLEKPYPNLKDA